MSDPKYSIIIPVYNRPQELEELLQSLTLQTFKDFEVLIIEDGSSETSEKIFEKYSSRLAITYFFKPNSGPGPSRNYGFQRAKGKFFIVFDSDCIIPPQYLQEVESFIQLHTTDAFGGPDRGHDNFTPLQQAMAYTMSAFLTTGGIRGGSSSNFQPRSFNMGMSRDAFQKTGGFHFDRYAEDIELSIRMKKLGLHVHLIRNAYVFHKRRTSLSQFYKQVSNFGKGRVLVGKKHKGAIKITHWIPSLFTLGLIGILPSFIISKSLGTLLILSYSFYLTAIAIPAVIETKSLMVGILSIPSALVQLLGYGIGFLREKSKFITSIK
jgi:glycosyltransferase involved in cell wall biosynthesis